jgi:hypothetical protein
VLSDPQGQIIDKGIYFYAKHKDAIIGTVSLKNGRFDL